MKFYKRRKRYVIHLTKYSWKKQIRTPFFKERKEVGHGNSDGGH